MSHTFLVWLNSEAHFAVYSLTAADRSEAERSAATLAVAAEHEDVANGMDRDCAKYSTSVFADGDDLPVQLSMYADDSGAFLDDLTAGQPYVAGAWLLASGCQG